MSYIPLDQCEKGAIYKLNSRNLSVGVYDGNEGFIGIRQKFSEYYLFTEYHHDQGPPYGTVYPLEKIGQLPLDIILDENIKHELGDSWAKRGDEIVPVIRRDLQKDEPAHYNRQGFVDLYADTNERLGAGIWPYIRGNDKLFKYLEAIKV